MHTNSCPGCMVRSSFNSKLWLLHIQNLHIHTYTSLFLHWLSFQHQCLCYVVFTSLTCPNWLFTAFFVPNFSDHYWSGLLLCFPCEFSCFKNNSFFFFTYGHLYIISYAEKPFWTKLWNYCTEIFYTQLIWCSQPVALWDTINSSCCNVSSTSTEQG